MKFLELGRGRQSSDDVRKQIIECDVLIMMYPNDKNSVNGLPHKFLNALACGKPVIVQERTYMAEIVESEGCGIACPWVHLDHWKGWMRHHRDDQVKEMGVAALKAAKLRYNWEDDKNRLINLYKGFVCLL